MNTTATSLYVPNGLNLADIAPARGAKYSPNLHAFLSSRSGRSIARFGRVYADKTGSLWLGFFDDTASFIGAKLSQVLCYGAKADSFSYCGMRELREVEGFWTAYVQDGRCAIDREHKTYFLGDDTRWQTHGQERSCLWCGKHSQVLKRWTETVQVEKEQWVSP